MRASERASSTTRISEHTGSRHYASHHARASPGEREKRRLSRLFSYRKFLPRLVFSVVRATDRDAGVDQREPNTRIYKVPVFRTIDARLRSREHARLRLREGGVMPPPLLCSLDVSPKLADT